MIDQGLFDAKKPVIASDSAGNTIMAWVQSDGKNQAILVSRFTQANKIFETPITISKPLIGPNTIKCLLL